MNELFDRVPIIKLYNQLLVPLQGEIADALAARLESEVLDRVRREVITGVVLEVTGVWMLDSHLCSVLSRIASCVRLMGVRTVISGMSPEIALTLETMGVELRDVSTALSLEEALEQLGVRAVIEGPDVQSASELDVYTNGAFGHE